MYVYAEQKKEIFTEEGQVTFLQVRDRCQKLIRQSGAVRMEEAIEGIGGDSWFLMACVDRLVELKDLREVTGDNEPGQWRVFVGRYEGW